jgi:hypothetical protein
MTLEQQWINYGKQHLEGKTVESVRYMTKDEMDELGWYSRSIVIHFTDGTVIFPSADDEGNNAGALFGMNKEGDLTFPVL